VLGLLLGEVQGTRHQGWGFFLNITSSDYWSRKARWSKMKQDGRMATTPQLQINVFDWDLKPTPIVFY
jgi:hypothetical protein